MFGRALSWLRWPSLVRRVVSNVRLSARLLREPRVPRRTKAWPILVALYVVSPLDLLPDVLPVLGQIDDMVLLLFALEGFARLCPPQVVEYHRRALTARQPYAPMPAHEEIIEGEVVRDAC